MIKISASLMCASPLFMYRDVQFLLEAGTDMFHFDIMDGQFVNNLALNTDLIKELRKITFKDFDTHLMVINPSRYIERLANSGVDIVTFHVECGDPIESVINIIRNNSMKVGLALKPETPISSVMKYVNDIDYLMFMTVPPGFAGQEFQEQVLNKIAQFKRIMDEKKLDITLIADGAIDIERLKAMHKLGVSIFVAGTSGLFNEEGFVSNVIKLKQSV